MFRIFKGIFILDDDKHIPFLIQNVVFYEKYRFGFGFTKGQK